jgi:hypothetical protein
MEKLIINNIDNVQGDAEDVYGMVRGERERRGI